MAMAFVAQSARGLGLPMVPQSEVDKAGTIVERFMIRWKGEPDPAQTRAVDAYFVSAAQHANHKALQTRIQVDDDPPIERLAHVIVVGNVGFLQGNLPLIPDARPDDGLLDVLIASPVTFRDWARVVTRVLTRQQREDAQLDRYTGRKVTITVDRRDAFQLDGDTVGECRTMTAEVQPGALVVRVPRDAAAPRATSTELVEVGEGLVGAAVADGSAPEPRGGLGTAG